MLEPAGSALEKIVQIAIDVSDLERATAFYRDTLGLRFLFSVSGMAFFDCGGVRLMLSRAEIPELDHGASVLYYGVRDIDAAHRTLVARGVLFEGPPHLVAKLEKHDVMMAFFHDSEGNMLAITCEQLRA